MRVIWDIFIGDVRNLFRNVIAAIVVMGLALVPPMYAQFTTLGFWDPYDNTGSIKVAVAFRRCRLYLRPHPDAHQCRRADHRQTAGQRPVRVAVRQRRGSCARRALWRYYATLVIPKEFSRDLATVFTDDITEPKIIYYDNEKENAIAQRVTATGASTPAGRPSTRRSRKPWHRWPWAPRAVSPRS